MHKGKLTNINPPRITTEPLSGNKGKFGANLGAGAEFDLNSQWMINFEIKYQIISDFDQGVFNIGVAYKF